MTKRKREKKEGVQYQIKTIGEKNKRKERKIRRKNSGKRGTFNRKKNKENDRKEKKKN